LHWGISLLLSMTKHKNKVRKHRRRGKFIYDDKWGFKQNFVKDYQDKKKFKEFKKENRFDILLYKEE